MIAFPADSSGIDFAIRIRLGGGGQLNITLSVLENEGLVAAGASASSLVISVAVSTDGDA